MIIKNILINPSNTIIDALNLIQKNLHKSVIVVERNRKLLGILSDADIRRALLKGVKLNDQIKKFYNKKILFVKDKKFDLEKKKKKIVEEDLFIVPVVDKDKKIVDLVSYKNLDNRNKSKIKDIPIVIMAGGKGKRLKPFTDILPKPLIPINNKTILEHIILNFQSHGMNNFSFITHHKSAIIKSYLKEINSELKMKYSIFAEKVPLGTSGGLKLLQKKINKDFFVSNCDTLVKNDLLDIYEHHKKNSNLITIVVSYKEYQIPYGIFSTNKSGKLDKIIEKPTKNYLVNTGLYVLNPKIFKYIKRNHYLDFDSLLKLIKKQKLKIGLFPIEDKNWKDVGQWTEYKQTIENFYE